MREMRIKKTDMQIGEEALRLRVVRLRMDKIKHLLQKTAYFSAQERLLWILSVALILVSYVFFRANDPMTLVASLIGVTSLIFNAKGNPFGQFLIIVFSLLYGAISYTYAYYGEMITYLGMTAPMALFALIAWLRHPYRGNRSEVAVNRLSSREIAGAFLLSLLVTAVFCYILVVFDTANLVPSTLSVTTSFLAVYLTFRRSPWFALAYAANDLVLIVLWYLAALEDPSYASVLVCFAMFFVNDLYGFVSWRKMQQRQCMYA